MEGHSFSSLLLESVGSVAHNWAEVWHSHFSQVQSDRDVMSESQTGCPLHMCRWCSVSITPVVRSSKGGKCYRSCCGRKGVFVVIKLTSACVLRTVFSHFVMSHSSALLDVASNLSCYLSPVVISTLCLTTALVY